MTDVEQAEYFRTRRIMRIRVEVVGAGGKVIVSSRQSIAVRKIDELRRVFNAHFKRDGITLSITTAPSTRRSRRWDRQFGSEASASLAVHRWGSGTSATLARSPHWQGAWGPLSSWG
jgi:hypothetical protein